MSQLDKLTLLILVVGLIIFLARSMRKWYKKIRNSLHIYRTNRALSAMRKIVFEQLLPLTGLELTDGEEVPDAKLTLSQVDCKRTANKAGFKVKLTSDSDSGP